MRFAAAALLVAAAMPALAADGWVRLTTPNFELYTDAGEKAARDSILYFEQVRDFFIKAAPVRFPAEFPVRVIVCKSWEEFAQQASNSVQIAFYAAGTRRDYIVMSDPSLESYAIAVHEYMHLIVRRSGLHIPVWLNEGLADVYSTLRPVRDGIAVGDLIPGRMQPLVQGQWLTFDELASVDARSPVYNEAARVGVFYGESWALAHMLFLSSAYRDNFGKFLMALNTGKSSAEACEIAYNRSSAEVYKDLQKYLKSAKLTGRVFVTKITKLQTEPESATLNTFDTRLVLADLQLDTGRLDRARTEFRSLEQEQPNRPEVTSSLGFLAIAAHDAVQARTYFEKAFAAGDSDPQLCLQLAVLERAANQPPSAIVPSLERAIRSKPDYTEAILQLGLTQIQMQNYQAAVNTLMSIQNVTPTQAAPVFSALAYAYLETGDLEKARANLATAEKWAKDGKGDAAFAGLQTLLDARAKLPAPPQPGEKLQTVEGVLQSLDCKTNPRHLVIKGASGMLAFTLPEPQAVEFAHEGGGPIELTCGTQMPRHITVQFAPGDVVRHLQF